jgi:hypothetical protein
MPYYNAGDYYQGDNYGAGDFLGIGKALKKLQPLKLLGGVAGRLIGGTPVGAIARTLIPSIGGNRSQLPGSMIVAPVGAPEPGISGIVHRGVPGGSSGYGYYNKKGEFVDGRRPRMNVANVHALKRAGRRVKGFLRVASRLGALPVNRGKGKLFKRKKR